MYATLQPDLTQQLQEIKDAGLFKKERIITSPQGAEIETDEAGEVLNFCANNYLGLSSPRGHQSRQRSHRYPRLRPVVGALYLRHPGHS